MITNDIPAIPQFLMRETDHHVLQAMATDEADRPAPGHPRPDHESPETASPPTLDLASVDLLAPDAVEASERPVEVAATPPRLSLNALTASATSGSGYSIEDLKLFRFLTGYRLDTRAPIWRAVDDEGNRVPITDRLFTTLAEEAFRFADRQRQLSGHSRADLTIADLVLTLSSIRRAANSIGSRGLSAFERLEAAITDFKEKTSAEEPAGMTPVSGEALETA